MNKTPFGTLKTAVDAHNAAPAPDGWRVAGGPTDATPARKKLSIHVGCGGVVGWDAWVDSQGDVCGGPYDNSQCMECGEENPDCTTEGN